MLRYFLRRFFVFCLTLFAITLFAFLIMVYTPGDPVASMMEFGHYGDAMAGDRAGKEEYQAMRRRLGLDLPVFYFSVTSLAEPGDLFQIARPDERAVAKALVYKTGNWKEIRIYFDQIRNFRDSVFSIPVSGEGFESAISIKQLLTELTTLEDVSGTESRIREIHKTLAAGSADIKKFEASFAAIEKNYQGIQETSTPWKIYVPAFRWYGFENQYHNWIGKLLVLDFGISYRDQSQVSTLLLTAMKWTFIVSFISIVLVYMISIPAGIFLAIKKNTFAGKSLSSVLFLLYSLPVFWAGSMLILCVCNPNQLDWFPAYGIQSRETEDWTSWQKAMDLGWHLALPVLCFTYGSLAFVSRQMQSGMAEFLHADFTRTARAKGLTENRVIFRHVFRNSLIPVITLFGGILPALVTGSVIIEEIFTIPGMGFESIAAYRTRDYPVIIAIFTILGILTQAGIFLSDILYAALDPRISFSKRP